MTEWARGLIDSVDASSFYKVLFLLALTFGLFLVAVSTTSKRRGFVLDYIFMIPLLSTPFWAVTLNWDLNLGTITWVGAIVGFLFPVLFHNKMPGLLNLALAISPIVFSAWFAYWQHHISLGMRWWEVVVIVSSAIFGYFIPARIWAELNDPPGPYF
jgi:hypothetical protein